MSRPIHQPHDEYTRLTDEAPEPQRVPTGGPLARLLKRPDEDEDETVEESEE